MSRKTAMVMMRVWLGVGVGVLPAFGETRVFMTRLQQDAPAGGDPSVSVQAGESASVAVWVQDVPEPGIKDSQIIIYGTATPTGGAVGTVQYLNNPTPPPPAPQFDSVFVDTDHPLWVFQAVGGMAIFYSEQHLPQEFGFVAFGPFGTGVPVPGVGYLGQFDVIASGDACGRFLVQFVPPFQPLSGGTVLAGPFGAQVSADLLPLEVNVPCEGAPTLVHAAGQPGETRPCTGYVDPRSESSDGVHLDRGVDSVTLVFSEPVFGTDGGTVGLDDFIVRETGGGTPPEVVAVDAEDNPRITVTLSRSITLQEWTTVQAVVENAAGIPIVNLGDLGDVDEPDRVDLAFLPCDVNQSGVCEPFDLLQFRILVNTGNNPDCGIRSDVLDIDRDGAVGPFDLLVFRQLVINVPPSTQQWNGEELHHPRP